MTVLALLSAAPSLAADPSVALLKSGAEPLTALRYAPAAGSTQELRVEMDVAMEMSMGGMAMPSMSVPTVFYELRAVVGEASTDLIPYTYTIADAGVLGDGAMASAMKADLEAIVGSTGTVRVPTSGRVSPASDSETAGTPAASLEQTLGQMSLTLPAEAVGVGGSWQLTESVVEGGLLLDQVTTWTLVEARPNQVYVVDVNVTQSGAEQAIQSVEGAVGPPSKLRTMSSVAQGRSVVSLGKLLPVEADMNGKATMEAETEAAGQVVPVSSQIDSKTRLRTK